MRLLSFLLLLFSAYTLTFTIPSGEEMCFFDELEEKEVLSGSFQITRGGDRKITGPKDNTILTFQQTSDQRFSFTALDAGIYKMCARNPSSFAQKSISLMTSINRKGSPDDQSLQGSLESLQTTLNGILTEQNYIKQREIITRDTTETTNSRVVWWSLIQIAVVLLTTAIQYFLFKKIFKRV